MKLIKNLKTKKIKGRLESYGLFYCEFCNREVVKHLSSGKRQRSCGCYGRHYEYNTRLYRIWRSMKYRCSNKNYYGYHNYGGRGIKVCDEWRKYINFSTWAKSNGYSDDLQIDRIDNNKGYYPDNCRWTTNAVNMRNRRCSKLNSRDVIMMRQIYKLGSLNKKKYL